VERFVLICDNLNTHTSGALYEAFPDVEARRLWQQLDVRYTPKHRSWLKYGGDRTERPVWLMPRSTDRRNNPVAA
jgi:hypothetical protein